MNDKYFLIMAKTTQSMLEGEGVLKKAGIKTDLVPAPPEHGTVCAIAIKVSAADLAKAEGLLQEKAIALAGIYEEEPLKLIGLLEKLGKLPVAGDFIKIIQKIEAGSALEKEEIIRLLATRQPREAEILFTVADRVQQKIVGDRVDIRGAIEFSNFCRRRCTYCGINADVAGLQRYRMTEAEIMAVVAELHALGLKTVILQSGEDSFWTREKLITLLQRIKKETGMRITLSVGEWRRADYAAFKAAGANNFLLKIETTNRELFAQIHPDTDYDQRQESLTWLKELGYLTGSGNILGLPGQTLADIAADILYFKKAGINMIGIGPFIPAQGTTLAENPYGDIQLTLKTVALTRIVCQKVYIPATTALASLAAEAQTKALQAGANSIMLINTPPQYRQQYNIYNQKNYVDLAAAIQAIRAAGRLLPDYLSPEIVARFSKDQAHNSLRETGGGESGAHRA